MCEQRLLPLAHINEEIDGKFICTGCQLKIVYNVANTNITVPELSIAQRVAYLHEKKAKDAEQVAVAKMRAISNEPGWVYYVRQGDLIKIGFTDNLKQRMRAYAPTGELLACHPGTLETEKAMHQKFSVALDSGREWFRQRPELMAHIASTVATFGDPSIFVYEYRKHLREGDPKPDPKYLTRV